MNDYCRLAKEAIKNYLTTGQIIDPPKDLPENFYKEKSGVFVTIENNGQLRGCIGTFLPTKENIAQEIIANAIAAATQDYRFLPITKEELSQLDFEVSVLEEPEPIKNLVGHDPKKYGLIVKYVNLPYKCGLLLPDLESVDTPQQQFLICCQKGRIDPEKETVALFRFKVEKYQ